MPRTLKFHNKGSESAPRRPLRPARVPKLFFVGLMFIVLMWFVAAQGRSGEGVLTAEKRAAIVERIAEVLNEYYVYPETAAQMEAHLRQELRQGHYDGIGTVRQFTDRLTSDMQSVSHDLHLRVYPYRPLPAAEQEDPAVARERRLARMRGTNFAFRKVEVLTGNIGYLKFDGFVDAREGAPTAIAALNFLAWCDALIIDLRDNGGGSPSMIQLMNSYFFDEVKHLNDFYIRKGDITRQFWTQAWVPGPRLEDTPLYVLTSERTFSAAEEFTYNLKNMERATIIGATTGGGAHPVNNHDFPEESITVNVPFGKAVNPISGTNWEGEGVAPHIAVSPEDALAMAHKQALQDLQAKTTDGDRKRGLQWALDGLGILYHPLTLDEERLAAYAGTYENGVKAWVEDGVLRLKWGSHHVSLAPLGENIFQVREQPQRVRFELNASGTVRAVSLLFEDGRVLTQDRVAS